MITKTSVSVYSFDVLTLTPGELQNASIMFYTRLRFEDHKD